MDDPPQFSFNTRKKQMSTQYRVICREDNKVVQYSQPDLAAIFLMGKLVSKYFVVKSDELGDRVVVMPEGEVGRGISLDRIEEAIRSQ